MSAAFAAPVAATNLLFLPTAHAPPLSLHQTAAATAAAAGFVFSNSFPAMADGPYTLPDLPYPYEALEPYIDAATMKVCANQNMRTWCTSSSAIVLRNYNGVSVVRIMTRGIQPYLPASLPPSCPGRLLRSVFFRLAVVRYRRTIVPSHPAPTTLLFSCGLMSPSLHRFRRCYFYLWPRDSTSTTRCTTVSRTSTLDSARSNVWTGEWNGSGVPLFASTRLFRPRNVRYDMGYRMACLQFHHDKHHAAYVANANKVRYCCCCKWGFVCRSFLRGCLLFVAVGM